MESECIQFGQNMRKQHGNTSIYDKKEINKETIEFIRKNYSLNLIDDQTEQFKIGDQIVTANVFGRLANQEKFDSDCLNCAIEYDLINRKKNGYDKFNEIFTFESHFFEYLQMDNCERFIERCNIENQSIFIIPKYYVSGQINHWYVYIFYPKRNEEDSETLINSNSLIVLNSSPNCHDDFKEDKKLIMKFWQKKFPLEMNCFGDETKYYLFKPNVPIQIGSNDCGPFSCYYIKRINDCVPINKNDYKNKELFSYDDANSFRDNILQMFHQIQIHKKEKQIEDIEVEEI